MGSYKGYRDPNARRGSTNFQESQRRSQRHELLGKAGPSQSDVLTAKEGKVYHFSDVENPSQSCS